jgi:hypothetical protein
METTTGEIAQQKFPGIFYLEVIRVGFYETRLELMVLLIKGPTVNWKCEIRFRSHDNCRPKIKEKLKVTIKVKFGMFVLA